MANGKAHFGPTERNDQTGQSGAPSKLIPNIPVGLNRNGPFHLMNQANFPEFWVEWKAPRDKPRDYRDRSHDLIGLHITLRQRTCSRQRYHIWMRTRGGRETGVNNQTFNFRALNPHQKIMDQETGLVLHHISLADNYNLDKVGDFLTQLHLATGLTEDQVANINAEVLKNLNLQDEDSTIKQFVFQGQCMILGDSGAGKTSLVNSLAGKPFDPSQTKTRKMEQKLVDEKWKNLGMKDLLFGKVWKHCHRICVQLTLYGPARRQNIFLRILDYWRNDVQFEFKTTCMLPLLYMFLITQFFLVVIMESPLLSPIVLLLVLLYFVFLYFLNCNYIFRLIVTTLAFTFRTQGLLIGSFSALTLICYHYGKISLNVEGFFLIILTLGLSTVVLILSGLGITWQYPYPRQMKFKYQRSLTIACFMPFLLSVLVGQLTFTASAILLINYCRGLGLSLKNPDECVQKFLSVFSFWWTAELLKSAYTYIKIILFKWLSRGIFKVAVTCTLIAVCSFLFIRLINMYWYLSFDSTIFLFFLWNSLFREQLNMQELGIEGNMFTLVVIEKQELRKRVIKAGLRLKFSSIKLRILDFPGEEEYHAFYRIFFRRKAFYVIVFNMMDFAENNFNEIDAKCHRLQFWFETLCSHVPPKTPIFLVGTQRGDMDRNNIKRLDTHLKRCLWNTYRDALVVNDTEYLVFFPIENSKGKEESGVQVLQEKITTVAKEKKVKETFGREIPFSWVRVQDAIISLKEQKGAKFCLCLEEFSNVVDSFDNFSSTYLSKEILQYFHETGLIIYLERDHEDLDLSKWILLKPEILVDIIIQLETPPPEFNQERGLRCDWDLLKEKGLLTESLLENIVLKLKENVEGMTALLEEYDLICPLANRKVNMCRVHEGEEQPTHFVPSMLPMASERDTPIWYDDDTDKKCYVFFTKFLPEPLFHHLLSRAHKLSRVEFPNGYTVLFRDAGKFWLSAWQPYSLKLMREENMIEVTFSYR